MDGTKDSATLLLTRLKAQESQRNSIALYTTLIDKKISGLPVTP